MSLTDWIKDQPSTRPAVAVDMDDVVMLSATGGTTGLPKGVMNTHRSVQTFCAQVAHSKTIIISECAGAQLGLEVEVSVPIMTRISRLGGAYEGSR